MRGDKCTRSLLAIATYISSTLTIKHAGSVVVKVEVCGELAPGLKPCLFKLSEQQSLA